MPNRPALGVIFLPSFSPAILPDYARRAEAAGFDELWLWDDCFLPGAFTNAAIALSSTERIKVGIGLLPAAAYNPLFASMEITTLALAYPGRFMPGFGHGVTDWMRRIGAAAKPSLKGLEETVTVTRHLLHGEEVTFHGQQVNFDQIQMHAVPEQVPPLYVGAMREKSLQLAGRIGDGTILTGMSSPAYVRWAMDHIRAGMAQAGRTQHRVVVYLNAKVNPDGDAARSAMRRELAAQQPWADIHLSTLGITEQVNDLLQTYGPDNIAPHILDAWLDEFSVCGTPDQAAASLQRWFATGVDSVVLQPVYSDPACLDEYINYIKPNY